MFGPSGAGLTNRRIVKLRTARQTIIRVSCCSAETGVRKRKAPGTLPVHGWNARNNKQDGFGRDDRIRIIDRPEGGGSNHHLHTVESCRLTRWGKAPPLKTQFYKGIKQAF